MIVTTPTSLGSGVTRVGRSGVPPQPDQPHELPNQVTPEEFRTQAERDQIAERKLREARELIASNGPIVEPPIDVPDVPVPVEMTRTVDHVLRPDIRPLTDDETRAIAEAHKSLDASVAKITQPHQLALTLTREPMPEPTLFERALDVERAKIDAEIARLMQTA